MKNTNSELNGQILYEGKLWYVDFTKYGKGGDAVVKIQEADGTWRDAKTDDAPLMDVLNVGHVMSRDWPKSLEAS